MATELTAEQKKALNKLARGHFLSNLVLGVSSGVTLVLFDLVVLLGCRLFEIPSPIDLVLTVVAAIYIFRKMLLDSKESHDRFIKAAQKITDQK